MKQDDIWNLFFLAIILEYIMLAVSIIFSLGGVLFIEKLSCIIPVAAFLWISFGVLRERR